MAISVATVGFCGNDMSQIPFGWFPTVWISEPVASVDTGILHQPAGSNLGHPRGQPQVYMNLTGRLHPPLPETTSLTSSPGRILVQYPK